MDAIAEVVSLPQPGETVLARGMSRLPGGKGANQAVAAARAGGDVWFVGRVGTDAYGGELKDSLQRAGVHTGLLAVDPDAPTGMAMITVDEHAENTIVVIPGANGTLRPDNLRDARDTIARSRVVIAQLEIPIETVYHAAELARAAGATFILNPAPAQPLEPALMQLVDVLVPNEDELARMSGLGSPIDPTASAYLLLDTGVSTIVVTRGAYGALVVSREASLDVPAFATRAVDTTGAGDAFVGNFARAIDRGDTVEEAARFANAAAAVSVRASGAQAAMPTEAETQAMLRGEVTE